MKIKRPIGALITALALFIALASPPPALAVGNGSTVYINTRQIANNLEYINTIAYSGAKGREEDFFLQLTGSGDIYPVVTNGDTIYGKYTISGLISYMEGLGKNVVAAINSDFFSMQTGVPFGIVIEDGIYKSSGGYEPAVCFMPDGRVYLADDALVDISLTNSGNISGKAGQSVSLTNFNKYRMDTGGLYLYSSDYSTVSTRTSTDGWFVRFKILDGSPIIGGTMQLEVAEMIASAGSAPIGDGYLVLTAATGAGYLEEFNKFAVGDIVTFSATPRDPNLTAARYATGGGDRLVRNGVITDSSGWDKDLIKDNAKAPRSALGIKPDGSIIFYVLDGRDTERSVGKSLTELAQYMLEQGCADVINLDGGGSSAISVKLPGGSGCTVTNKPSDKTERPCATYILLVTDKVRDGVPRSLAIKNDGAILLTESKLTLDFTAVDSGFATVAAPFDVTAASIGNGMVQGAEYTAGPIAGIDKLTLSSQSANAYGTAEIMVIAEPTSIFATRQGETARLASLLLMPGESVALEAGATYYRREVTAQNSSFSFTTTSDIGAITPDGVFTAAIAPGATGVITIAAGTTTLNITVEIGGFDDMTGHWAKDYVNYLASSGIVKGMTDTQYSPEQNIKRGDFMLMLYRAAGQPAVTVAEGFTDVPTDAYYTGAIMWAQSMGIAQGMGDGSFDPNGTLTREQAFTFVYRALGMLNVTYTDADVEYATQFFDAADIADYAVVPAATLVQMNVVQGADGYLTPKSSLTRAQMAKILCVVLRDAPTFS